jgi:hypothetical protein
MEDLIAMVFWDKGNSKSLLQEINNEKQEGTNLSIMNNS